MSSGSVVHAADTVLIVAGIGLLIVRQFRWRTLDPRGLLVLPLGLIALGLAYVVVGIIDGAHRPAAADAVVLPAEFALVAITGSVMAFATTFRTICSPDDAGEDGPTLQYRLTRIGLLLWALFIAVRVGSFVVGTHLGARLPDTTGAILLSFGLNRLICGLVVWRRAPSATGGAESVRIAAGASART